MLQKASRLHQTMHSHTAPHSCPAIDSATPCCIKLCAVFGFAVMHCTRHGQQSSGVTADTLHRFCKKEHDWGWKKFMELSKVLEGFTVANTLVIKAQVQVIRYSSEHKMLGCKVLIPCHVVHHHAQSIAANAEKGQQHFASRPACCQPSSGHCMRQCCCVWPV